MIRSPRQTGYSYRGGRRPCVSAYNGWRAWSPQTSGWLISVRRARRMRARAEGARSTRPGRFPTSPSWTRRRWGRRWRPPRAFPPSAGNSDRLPRGSREGSDRLSTRSRVCTRVHPYSVVTCWPGALSPPTIVRDPDDDNSGRRCPQVVDELLLALTTGKRVFHTRVPFEVGIRYVLLVSFKRPEAGHRAECVYYARRVY